MKDLQHIGSIETISLPDEGLKDVPAKIDTGADSSAIWASKITEKDGALSFALFGDKSSFYTGKLIKTTDYTVISVKNSFGHSERRYKVHLKITLVGRTIRASFTLSNRQKSRYPILIGRRTLHGKFLVDVTHKSTKSTFDVLMLSTKKTTITAAFAKSLEVHSDKLKLTYAAYDDLSFSLGEPASRFTLLENDRDLASFDLVYFKTTAGFQDISAAAANYLDQRNVPFIDRAFKDFPGTSKLYQYSILADNGITIPPSIFMLPVRLEKSYDYLLEQLGQPFIIKDVHGQKGNYNFLINNRTEFEQACETATKQGVWCIAQSFIPNDGDYRVLVFGKEIALVIKRRRRNDDSHLNNTSKGAEAIIESVDKLPPAVRAASIASAKLLRRQVAGVDIVQDKATGLWYCLEVNDVPQLATGSFVAQKQAAFAAYLEYRLRK